MQKSTKVMVLLITVAACKTLPPNGYELRSNGIPLGEFRGYTAVNKDVEDLFFGKPTALSSLRSYEIESSLQLLVGSFHTNVKKTTYLGGQPNGGNFLIWSDYFNSMLKDFISLQCDPPKSNSFGVGGTFENPTTPNGPMDPVQGDRNPPLTGVPSPIDQSIQGASYSDLSQPYSTRSPSKTPLGMIALEFCGTNSKEVLKPNARAIFSQFVTLPDRGLQPWENYFWGAEYEWQSSREALSDMLMALLMDPYFLLERQ